MRDEMTPQEFDEWIAYSTIESFDDGWLQTGIIAATTQNSITAIAASYGGKKLRQADYVEPTDFVPGKQRRRHKQRMTPAQALAQIEAKANKWRR